MKLRVATCLLLASSVFGLVQKSKLSSTLVASREAAAQPAASGTITKIEHKKEAGGLYLPGSPKYEKQQQLKQRGELKQPDRLAPHQVVEGKRRGGGGQAALPAPKGAVSSEDGKYTAMFTKDTMPKVSPTVKSVISLTFLYFAVYTALAIVRTMSDFGGTSNQPSVLLNTIQVAATVVGIAPMLCVLFVGCRMRAIQLTDGNTEKYGLPPDYVQDSMYWAVAAIHLQTLMVLLIPVVNPNTRVNAGRSGEVEVKTASKGALAVVLTTIWYVAIVGLLACIIIILVGTSTMKPPAELWKDTEGGRPPVSPAVKCVMILTMCYFFVFLGCAIASTLADFGGGSAEGRGKIGGAFTSAKSTTSMIPMMCILFVGARMRALQIDPKNGNPQGWAQNCFYAATIGVVGQTLMVILMPFIDPKCTVMRRPGSVEMDIVFQDLNASLATVMTVLRYCFLFCIYVCSTAVMISVFTIENKEDVNLTPAISPAVQCVMNLTVQFFVVFTTLFIAVSVKQFSGGCELMIRVMDGASKTVLFAPMLGILFLACRMRALQLTRTIDNKVPPTAGPQPWAQEGMYWSTWALLIQVVMAILVPLALSGGQKVEVDDDGNVVPPAGNKTVATVLTVIRYLCLIFMYGGAISVMYGIHTMSPEQLPPYVRENEPLVEGVPAVPPPPSPDTPGTATTTTTLEYKPAWGAPTNF